MAAEEVVGSLAVKLALSSGSFDAGMKRVGTELKAIDSGFKASAAEAAAAGQKYDSLGQKQIALAQKLTVQQSATVAYRSQLEQLRTKMASLGSAQTELKDKVSSAKVAYEQAKNELKAHQKAGDLAGDEMQRLADRVEQLKTEYKSLTDQQKQVASNMASLQGKISSTEAAYNGMRTQTAQTRQELNRTEAEIKSQTSAWGKLEAAAEKTEKRFGTAGKTLNSFGNKATIGLTAPITAGLYVASDAALDFEDRLAKIATVADTTKKGLASIGTELLQISDDTNTAIGELAEAEYQAISAGVATSQSTQYMAVSTKAAKGGFSDLTTAVNGSTSVLNAWNLDASVATDIYNKMIVAQNLGKTTLGETAGSIGLVAATASGLKVSYGEVLAASAAMTMGGISTSQSMTMLNQVLASVLKPSADAKKTAKELGLEFDATAIKSKGLAGFIADIGAKANGNEEALARLFGSVEAYKAVASLAGAQSETFTKTLDAMNNSAGAVDQAFETISNTRGNKLAAMFNRLKNSALQFGDTMLPAIGNILDKVDGLVTGLSTLDDTARTNLLFGAGALALIGPTTKALGGIVSTVSGIAKLVTVIGKAGGLSGALGLVGLPLAAGAAGLAIFSLISKIAEANSDQAKLKNRIISVGIELDDNSKADFDAKVNDVLTNTKKVMEIQAKVDVEKTDLASDLESAIADGKLTKGEGNKLRKTIDAWVDDAIAGVKTDTATKAAEIAAALDGIAGLSDESKTKIVAAAETSGDKQIAELQGYQTELNTLLDAMKGGTESITADKIARYNELLALIATMKGEIVAANEGLAEYYKAQQVYIQSGEASPEQAQAYTTLGLKIAGDDYATKEQARKTTIAQKQKALEAAQAAADETGDDSAVVIMKEGIKTEFQNEEQAKKDYQDKIVAILNDGVAAAAQSVEGGENRLGTLLDNYVKLGFLNGVDKSADMSTSNPEFRTKLQTMLAGLMKVDPSKVDVASMVEDGTLDILLDKYKTELGKQITSEMETGDFNPVMEMLKSSMEGVDLSGVDTSKLGENVKGLFAMLDFKTSGGEVSTDIWQGLADGLTENYGIAGGAMDTASKGLIAQVKAAWGIQSPSTVMKDIYKNVILGGAQGVNENIGLLTTPFQTLTTEFPQIGQSMMDGLISGIQSRSETLKAAIRNSIRRAMDSAQLIANTGIKIPVRLTYTDASTKKLSQQIGL